MAAAPTTIQEGTVLPTVGGLQFEYKPDLGIVPTFSLPTNLPLGKLANISFGGPTDAHIAPSIGNLPNLSLPALPAPPIVIPSSVPVAPVTGSIPVAPPVTVGIPPQPTRPASGSSSGAAPSAHAPPIPDGPLLNSAPSVPSPPPDAGGGDRGSLMEAIRANNASRLKRAAARVLSEAAPEGKAAAGGGGGGGAAAASGGGGRRAAPEKDIMTALKDRLAILRSATSGRDGAPKERDADKGDNWE